MGRQHQRIDRPGVRQVPEGSGEQSKLEDTGCDIICDAPTTPVVKGRVKVKVKDSQELDSKGRLFGNGRSICEVHVLTYSKLERGNINFDSSGRSICEVHVLTYSKLERGNVNFDSSGFAGQG